MWPTSIAGVNDNGRRSWTGVAVPRLADVGKPRLKSRPASTPRRWARPVRAGDELPSRSVRRRSPRRRCRPARASRRLRRTLLDLLVLGRTEVAGEEAQELGLAEPVVAPITARTSVPSALRPASPWTWPPRRSEQLREALDRRHSGRVDLLRRVEPLGKLRRRGTARAMSMSAE